MLPAAVGSSGTKNTYHPVACVVNTIAKLLSKNISPTILYGTVLYTLLH